MACRCGFDSPARFAPPLNAPRRAAPGAPKQAARAATPRGRAKPPGEVRLIGGLWKRSKLPVPERPGLRPTPDRVRESLFNWLGQDLTGWRVLDAFAGSGALGFEAASRGAAAVTLVERDPRTFAVLRDNAAVLNTPRLEPIRADALKFLARPPRRYDVLFLDPPYRQDWIARIAPRLEAVLAPEARIYAEAEAPIARIGPWEAVRSGKSGQVYYHLLERAQA